MKNLLYICILIGFVPLMGQKKSFPVMYGSYLHPAWDSIAKTHHLVAFVDEYAYLSRRVDQKSKQEYDSLMTKPHSVMSMEFYKAWKSNPDAFTVPFQHPDSTCSILKKNGLSAGDLFFTSREKLAALLGVDAVVTVRYLIYKKYEPAEATMLNIASLAATVGYAAMGNYAVFFPYQAGTDALYASTTIHNSNGELLYLDKGLENVFTKLSPGGWKNRKNLPGFPYLK